MQCGLEDTSLPRMPTPTATPRGVATPRAGEEATLAKTLNFCAYLPAKLAGDSHLWLPRLWKTATPRRQLQAQSCQSVSRSFCEALGSGHVLLSVQERRSPSPSPRASRMSRSTVRPQQTQPPGNTNMSSPFFESAPNAADCLGSELPLGVHRRFRPG